MKFSSHKLHKKIWYILAGEGVERDRQRDKTCRKEDARKVRNIDMEERGTTILAITHDLCSLELRLSSYNCTLRSIYY